MKVLFIDDNSSDLDCFRIVAKAMPNVEFDFVSNFKNAKIKLGVINYDAILSGFRLEDALSAEVIEYIRNIDTKVPIIIILKESEENKVVDILQKGATDYVLWNNTGKLPIVLLRAIKQVQFHKSENLAFFKLKNSERQYKLLSENINEGILFSDENGTILFVNKMFCTLTGYSKVELLGVNGYELLTRQKIHQNLKEKISDRKKGTEEFYKTEFIRKDGQTINITIHATPIFEENKLKYIMSIINKVTDETEKDRLFNQINESLIVSTGYDYFTELTTFLSKELKVKIAMVGFYHPDANNIESISFRIDGTEVNNIVYSLENTPCSKVINKSICKYPDKIQELFPLDVDLKTLNAKSYIGIPLYSDKKDVLGILVIIDDKPMTDIEEKEYILSVVSIRASNELNRIFIERDLLSSEQKQRTLFDSMVDVYYQLDLNKIIKMVSPSVYAASGFTPDELIGKSIMTLYENPNESVNLKERLIREGKLYDVEATLLGKNGQQIHTSSNISLILDSNNKPTGVQGIIRDITIQKKQQLELAKRETMLREAQQIAKMGSWEWNTESKSIFLSTEMYSIMEIEEAKYDGQLDSIINLIHPDSTNLFKSDDDTLRNEIEIKIISGKGKEKILLLRGTAGIETTPSNTVIYGTALDITDLRSSEIEKENLLNDLTIKYNQLMQFNYIVSHNLRSPITNILGLSNIINLPNVVESKKLMVVEKIQEAALKMDDLLKDLGMILTTRSNINNKKEDTVLSLLIVNVQSLLEKDINDLGAIIEIDISEECVVIFTIKNYLQSIFYNLINNALKYNSPSRKLAIKISAVKVNNDIVITFSDNGIGIDLTKHKENIFGLYKRFNTTINGKGLGLYMVKTQVESMGGTIMVESNLDIGTKFIIQLPFDT